MLRWKIADIAQAVQATNPEAYQAEGEVTSVSFDSRTLQEGALFVPLVAKQDGHDYVSSAIEKGARATFWSKDLKDAPAGIILIEVADTHQALMDFAKAYLQEVDPIVVAVTGSNGKTTTKDMTAAILQRQYTTHKTDGNFNNNIGLPMTLLSMPRDTEVAVLEMGMNQAGEIRQLSLLAEPQLAVITMVGESHIEFFEGREGIADAKFEITDGLKEEGTLIYNGDDSLLQERVDQKARLKSFCFGLGEHNDLYALFIESLMTETHFTTNRQPGDQVTIPLPGAYNVNNALAAMAVGLALKIPYEAMKEALADFELTANRLEWVDGPRQSLLLNDAYNASPTSMKASISSFLDADYAAATWLVLGDMGELGQQSLAYHADLILAIDPGRVDHVVLFGPQMQALYQALQVADNFDAVDLFYVESDLADLIDYLNQRIQPHDRLLFKSSFSTDLITVVQALRVESNEED